MEIKYNPGGEARRRILMAILKQPNKDTIPSRKVILLEGRMVQKWIYPDGVSQAVRRSSWW